MPGQLTIGDVLTTTLTVIQKNFLTFVGLVLVVLIPNFVVAVGVGALVSAMMPSLVPTPGTPPNPEIIFQNLGMILPVYLITLVVMAVTYTISQAGMTYTAVEHMAGRRASVGNAILAATRSLVPLLVCGFLVGLLTAIGTLMCIVPGLIVALYLCLATPAILVERLGPIDGMQRSAELTEGHKVSIFLVFLALFGAAFVLSLCVIGPINAALVLGTLRPGEVPDPFSPAQIVSQMLSMTVNSVLSAFGTATVAVIYAKIRGIRDGIDADAFAKVFA